MLSSHVGRGVDFPSIQPCVSLQKVQLHDTIPAASFGPGKVGLLKTRAQADVTRPWFAGFE